MRAAFPFLVVLGLLLIAVLLPSKRDTSVAAWGSRVLYQINFFARATLAVVCLVALVWFVLLPLLGWRAAAR